MELFYQTIIKTTLVTAIKLFIELKPIKIVSLIKWSRHKHNFNGQRPHSHSHSYMRMRVWHPASPNWKFQNHSKTSRPIRVPHFPSSPRRATPPSPDAARRRRCDPRAERGGEAVGGEGRGRDPVAPLNAVAGGPVPVQPHLRVQLRHQRPRLPHARHLRHGPPHGARIR